MIQSIPTRAVVELRALNGEAYRVIARVIWSDGVVSVEGEPDAVADLNEGIERPLSRERVLPSDGFRFLSAVLAQYQSPYLLATYEEADIS